MLELPAAAVEMRAAALLMSGQEGGDLDLLVRSFSGPGLTVGSDEPDEEFRNLLAVVEIDGIGVLEAAQAASGDAAGGGAPPRLEVFVYVVGPSLDVLDAIALRLDRPADHETQLVDAGVRVLAPLRLDLGRAGQDGTPPEIRVLARVGESFGLRRVELPPRTPASDDPSEPPPVTPEMDDSGRWLVAWSSERSADYPAAGLAFDPASVQPSAFDPPPELAEVAGEPWPSLMRRHGTDVLAGVMPSEAAPEIQLPEELGRRLQAVLDGYLEAVSMRAHGDTHGAAYYLAELEAKAMDELGADGLTLLLGQEVRGFQRLRGELQTVKPLIALIRLHLDVADEHRREGRYLLGSFAMSSAVRITDWYAEEAERGRKGDELRAEVAEILTSLAGEVQVRGSLSDAVGLYRRALGHRSDEPIALFGLASMLAKVGEPGEAAKLYEQLVESEPGHHEARLRWAVMLHRLGGARNLSKAGREYRILTSQEGDPPWASDAEAEPVPDWIASLAAQQLVRLEMDGGHLDRASRSLDAALARWPELGPLRVASIRLAEMQGDRKAVDERLRPFQAGAQQALRPGGRTRFHEAPNAGLRGLKARLSALEGSRHTELAEAADELLRKRGGGGPRAGGLQAEDRGGAP